MKVQNTLIWYSIFFYITCVYDYRDQSIMMDGNKTISVVQTLYFFDFSAKKLVFDTLKKYTCMYQYTSASNTFKNPPIFITCTHTML